MKTNKIAGIASGLVLALWGLSGAHEGMEMEHSGHEMKGGEAMHEHHHEEAAEKGFSKMVKAGGITVAFYIESSEAHMKTMHKMAGDKGMKMSPEHMKEMMKYSHMVSVSFIDDTKKESIEVTNGRINVVSPDGKSEKKDLGWMAGMKHYGALYNLGEKGKYEISVSFKIGSEEKTAAITYGEAAKKGDAENGRKLYESKCASCHGKNGDPGTATMKSLKPKPVNLSDEKAISHMTEAEIVKTVSEGGKATGHSTLMPAWGKQIGEDGVIDVVEYLKVLCKCGFGKGSEHHEHHHE